jgi:hypothetical protein
MWLFTTKSFLSIVEHRDRPDVLMVRARIRGDIERYFPNAKVIRDDKADYLFRAILPKHKVAAKLFDVVAEIDYLKFKSSVRDKRREAYYFSVWDTCYLMQEELSR